MPRGDQRHTAIEPHLDTIFAVARRTAYGLGTNRFEADEVAQLTALKLWRNWDRPTVRNVRDLDAEARWIGYIRQVARNVYIDQVRSHQRRLARQEKAYVQQTGHHPGATRTTPFDSTGIDAWLARATIAEEVLRLPTQQRKVAARLFLEEKSVAEVAAELGIEAQTVRKHARAARATLRRRLSETEPQRL